jgi:hypothetical protein
MNFSRDACKFAPTALKLSTSRPRRRRRSALSRVAQHRVRDGRGTMRAEPEVAKLRRQAQIVRTQQPETRRATGRTAACRPQLSIRRQASSRIALCAHRPPNAARPRIGRERSHSASAFKNPRARVRSHDTPLPTPITNASTHLAGVTCVHLPYGGGACGAGG